MEFGNCLVYGKTPLLKRIFGSKRGYIIIPADISLKGLDGHIEEE